MFSWITRKKKEQLNPMQRQHLMLERQALQMRLFDFFGEFYGREITMEEALDRLMYDVENIDKLTISEMTSLLKAKGLSDKLNIINERLGE